MLFTLTIFTITARVSLSTGHAAAQYFNGKPPLQSTLGDGRLVALVRRLEAQIEHLSEGNKTLTSGSKRVAVVAANGDSSVGSSNGEAHLAQTFHGGRPTAMVRRHEKHGKQVVEVASNGESSILLSHILDASRPATVVRRHETQSKHSAEVIANADNIVALVRHHEIQTEHPTETPRSFDSIWSNEAGNFDNAIHPPMAQTLDSGHPTAMVRRPENQGGPVAEMAANGDGPLQSPSELDTSGHALNAGDSSTVIRRHDSQGEHRATSKERAELIRSRRLAVEVATNDTSMASGNALAAPDDDRLSMLRLSAGQKSPGHRSVHRKIFLDLPEASFDDFTISFDSSSPRGGIGGLKADFNSTSPVSALAHASAAANSTLTSQSVAAASRAAAASREIASAVASVTLSTRAPDAAPEKASAAAPVVRKTNVAGLGPVRGAVSLAEAQPSAVQQPLTTAAPILAALAPTSLLESPTETHGAPSLGALFVVACSIVLILGIGVSSQYSGGSWREPSSDRPPSRPSLRRSSSARRSRPGSSKNLSAAAQSARAARLTPPPRTDEDTCSDAGTRSAPVSRSPRYYAR